MNWESIQHSICNHTVEDDYTNSINVDSNYSSTTGGIAVEMTELYTKTTVRILWLSLWLRTIFLRIK